MLTKTSTQRKTYYEELCERGYSWRDFMKFCTFTGAAQVADALKNTTQRNFIPTNKKFFQDMWRVIQVDIFMTKKEEEGAIGHNRLAGLIYFLTFIVFGIQCLTGFGLYAAMSDWWLPNLFSWVAPSFGGDFMLRQIHHGAMWFFILFTVVHVYLVFYHDYAEERGELSSMAGGWKFIEEKFFHMKK